jgi:phosphatidylinositol-3-phosphatase
MIMRLPYGGGHIVTIVITNHGPRGVTDPTPYNHYSLLRICEEAFDKRNICALRGADNQGVKAMTPLFEPSSAK